MKQHLFMLALVIIIAVSIAAGGTIGRKTITADRITAKEILVEGDDGSILLKGPNIIVLDRHDKPRLRILVVEDDADNAVMFALCDETGKPRVAMQTGGDDTGLDMYGRDYKMRFNLAIDKDGSILGLHDPAGRQRVGLVAIPSAGVVGVKNAAGRLVRTFSDRENP